MSSRILAATSPRSCKVVLGLPVSVRSISDHAGTWESHAQAADERTSVVITPKESSKRRRRASAPAQDCTSPAQLGHSNAWAPPIHLESVRLLQATCRRSPRCAPGKALDSPYSTVLYSRLPAIWN